MIMCNQKYSFSSSNTGEKTGIMCTRTKERKLLESQDGFRRGLREGIWDRFQRGKREREVI